MVRGSQSNEDDRLARAHVVVARVEGGSLSKIRVPKAVGRTGQLRFLGKEIGDCARPCRLPSSLSKVNKHPSAFIISSLVRIQDRHDHLGFQLRSYSSNDPVFCIGATLVNRDCLFRRPS